MSDIFDDIVQVTKVAKPLMLVMIGPSGSGKSTTIGTLGLPTLFITRGIETHGADNAASVNPNIHVLKLDRASDGSKLTADQEVQRLITVLESPKLSEQFKVVAIDGFTEFCKMFTSTTEMAEILSQPKTIKALAEADYVEKRITELISRLVDVNERGLSVLATCAGSITSDPNDQDSYEIKPDLPGHKTGQLVARAFPEIVAIGKSSSYNEETGEVKSEHRFFFHANMVKRSTDKKGIVTKQSSFSPRLRGVYGGDLPANIPANLKDLIKLRKSLANKAE